MAAHSPFLPGSPTHSLAQEVLRKFRAWRRKTPPGNRRIPEDLWVAATQLAESSTVHQTSRILGLDYRRLKTRVIVTCGPDCAALPGRSKAKAPTAVSPSSIAEPARGVGLRKNSRGIPPGRDHLVGPLSSPAVGLTTRAPGSHIPFMKPSDPTKSPDQPRRPQGAGSVSLATDGFLEASVGAPQTWLSPLPLAEIHSPAGALLRLFSPDSTQIIQAFLRP